MLGQVSVCEAVRLARAAKSSLTLSALVLTGTVLVLSSTALQAAPITAVQNTSWGQFTAGSFAVTGSRTAADPDGGIGNVITATTTAPAPGSLPAPLSLAGQNTLGSQAVGLTGVALTLGGPALISGTIITFTNTSETPNTTATVKVAANFTPPGNSVTTPLTVALGSTATLGASTFALSGSFATIATDVDYDPASANYGNLSGVIPASAFIIQGTGTSGTIALSLNSDLPWMVNMAPVWAPEPADLLAAGLSVPFSTPLSGMLIFGVSSTPFSGSANGDVTFFGDNTEEINSTFNFTSAFGPLSGTLDASGTSFLTPVPEPESYALMLAGLGLIGFVARRRKQQRPDRATGAD